MPVQDLFGWENPGVNADVLTANPGRVRLQTDANGNPRLDVLLYVPSTLQANLAIGQPYYIDYNSTAGQHVIPAAPAGNATSGITRQLCVLVEGQAFTGVAPATGTYAWFAVQGHVNVLVDGTTDVSKGDFLKSNSTVKSGALIKDSATQSSLSVGIALAAQTSDSAVLTECYLFGDARTIA